MFRGQFVHSIDAKGRISLPARFRDAIVADGDSRLVMTPSPRDPCLDVYPFNDWLELERKISDLPRFEQHVVRFRRIYVSRAIECEIDKSGRVLVSPDLRTRAKLEKEVLWAGMGRHIELWSRDLWEDATAELPEDEQDGFLRSFEELVRV